MSIIADLDFEVGDLSEYSSTSGAGQSAQAAAAMAGTNYGHQIIISSTTARYGQFTLGTADTSGKFRIRYYFDPNSITMANGDQFTQLIVRSAAGNSVALVDITFVTGTGYRVKASGYNDDSSATGTSFYTFTDAAHFIEIYLTRATTSSSNDGSLLLQVDGVDQQTLSALDNANRFSDFSYFRLGAPFGLDAGTSGTIYYDQIVANNDGNPIGPVASGIAIPVLLAQYRQRRN